MDGNRRYAKAHNLPTVEGHVRGYEKAMEVARWCKDAGITHLILYTFSSENWNRSPEEVAYLLDLITTKLRTEARKIHEEGGALRIVGERARFGSEFETMVKEIEAHNPTDPALTIVLALSYGGRQEILTAVNALVASKPQTEITEAIFSQALYTHDIPDPDLIIRPGGEKRLSNFLPWQSVYSELFFVDQMWPDFSKKDFDHVLEEFASRERRMGK